ncbi:MAG: MliC family protein [Panacagrimonas sp.]
MPKRARRRTLALCAALLAATSTFAADTAEQPASRRGIPPGWGKAAQVCEPHRFATHQSLIKGKGRSDFPTGFYRISRMPDASAGFLDVEDPKDPTGRTALLRPSPAAAARAWLISEVGIALYQVATCVQGQPRCLVLERSAESGDRVVLDICEYEAMGTAAWWSVQFITAPVKGGFELGSDGAGRLECLVPNAATQVPQLEPCPDGERETAWRIEPVAAPTPSTPTKPAVVTPAPDPEHYDCENGSTVEVVAMGEDREQIRVRYKNQWQTMKPAISASGSRYVGKTLEWWTKGMVEGNLFRHLKDGNPGDLVTRCSRPDPEPVGEKQAPAPD